MSVLCMYSGYLSMNPWKKGQSRKVPTSDSTETGSTFPALHYKNKNYRESSKNEYYYKGGRHFWEQRSVFPCLTQEVKKCEVEVIVFMFQEEKN